jgi:hypothetical protein
MMLSDEQAEKLRLMLSTAGWAEVMKPAIENRVRQAIQSLILPAPRRAEEDRNDEALRARIDELKWFLSAFYQELEVNEINRRADESARLNADEGSPDGQILNR